MKLERSWRRARRLLKKVVRMMLMRDDSGLKGGERSACQRGWGRTTRESAQRWRQGERPSLESGQVMLRSQAGDHRPIHNLFKLLLKKRKMKVLVAQSCPTLCNPMDCSLLGSSVHRILQARILEWLAIPFSRDLPDTGIELRSPALQADSLPLSHWESPSLCSSRI